MAWTETDTGSTSVSATSSLATKTDAKTYVIEIDLSPIAAGDVFALTVNTKVLTGSTARVSRVYNFVGGLISEVNFASDAFIAQHSLEFSLAKVSGTTRTIDWSVRSQG